MVLTKIEAPADRLPGSIIEGQAIMGNWRRLCINRQRRLYCDGCGAPDSEGTHWSFMFRATTDADVDKLIAFAYGGMNEANMPDVYGPFLVITCKEHTDRDVIRAGFVPPVMMGQMGNLADRFDSWIEENWHQLRLPGVPETWEAA